MAALEAQRAAESAKRYAALARVGPRGPVRQLLSANSFVDDPGMESAAAAVAAARATLPDIANLAAAMSAEVDAAREEAKGWERAVVEAEKEVAVLREREASAGGVNVCDDAHARAAAAAAAAAAGEVASASEKAELAVSRAEAMAREVGAGEAAAAASFRAWELAVAEVGVLAAGRAGKGGKKGGVLGAPGRRGMMARG